ncbi:MAG: arginase family protein [Thermomicrobiales bacterium]
MRMQIVSPASVEGTPGATGKTAALARGGEALLNSGIVEEMTAAGRVVAGVSRPALLSDQVTDDPIVNLGRFNRLVADAVVAGAADDAVSLLVGGTCGHLIGMMAGLQRVYGADARIGLVWFDAHGDFNTPRTTRSGMLGGMPVATCAGLCHAAWREEAGQAAPLPTDRIVMVDVRNLDPEEATLIAATDVQIARFGPGGMTDEITDAVATLAERVDHLYLHVDADVLDVSLQPNHPTAEPGGPDLAATREALASTMVTDKVRAFGVVSVNPDGADGQTSLASGKALLLAGVERWGSPHV